MVHGGSYRIVGPRFSEGGGIRVEGTRSNRQSLSYDSRTSNRSTVLQHSNTSTFPPGRRSRYPIRHPCLAVVRIRSGGEAGAGKVDRREVGRMLAVAAGGNNRPDREEDLGEGSIAADRRRSSL